MTQIGIDDIADKFEPESLVFMKLNGEFAVQASIAISLKRIADALEKANEPYTTNNICTCSLPHDRPYWACPVHGYTTVDR